MCASVSVGLCDRFETLCVGVHPSDASAGLLSLSALFTRSSAPLQIGLITDIFIGLLEAFATPHAHPCMLAHPTRVHANLHPGRPNTAQSQRDQLHCF